MLSEASLSFGVPPVALAGLALLLVTARVMATAAMMTITAAPIPVSQLRRRLRAASWARISATRARAAALFALDPPPWPALGGFPLARPPLAGFPLPWLLPPWFPRPLLPACLGT